MGEPKPDDKGTLIRVATAISDGIQVDWEKESSDRAEMRSKLGRLRLLEAIASAHRPPATSRSSPAASTPVAVTDGRNADAGPSEHRTDVIPSQWGPLQILALLGKGGFGEVYRAYDPRLQREVALKLRRTGHALGERETRAFLDEARRLARVRHPNVLVVHGADEHDGRVGIWTDLLEGKTLEACLKEQGTFGAREAALIGIDLCGALAAVHSAGLVHRDVKTTNVMREKGGRIVLMDFGSASEAVSEASVSPVRERAGTAMVMAPEVLLHGQAPSRAADIYGLGVLLYRLVSGRFPIETDGLSELVDKHRRGDRIPLRDVRPDLPLSFVQVVERALASDPERRHASAGAMEQALVASLDAREPIPAAKPASGRRMGWTHAAAALALVGLLGLGLWAVWPRRLAVEATLYRENAGAREILRSGASVKPGDHLGLEVLGSEQLYVYVLNVDAQGIAYGLFPAGLDLGNPLPPRIRVQLPGRLAGTQQYWVVSNAAGGETILVVVSREPQEQIERIMSDLPSAEAGRPVVYREIDRQQVASLVRGIGGMGPSTLPSSTAAADGLRDLIERLPQGADVGGGVWVRRFDLENPE